MIILIFQLRLSLTAMLTAQVRARVQHTLSSVVAASLSEAVEGGGGKAPLPALPGCNSLVYTTYMIRRVSEKCAERWSNQQSAWLSPAPTVRPQWNPKFQFLTKLLFWLGQILEVIRSFPLFSNFIRFLKCFNCLSLIFLIVWTKNNYFVTGTDRRQPTAPLPWWQKLTLAVVIPSAATAYLSCHLVKPSAATAYLQQCQKQVNLGGLTT